MDIVYLSKSDPNYPPVIKTYLGDRAPQSITVLGNLNILRHKMLALFCSVRCVETSRATPEISRTRCWHYSVRLGALAT